MIELKNISKSYDQKRVLQSINIEFASEKTHVLLGSSGCGKSTMLRSILGLIQVDEGEVIIDSKPLSSFSRRDLGRHFGYVLQNAALFPHMSVRENVMLPARAHGVGLDSVGDRIEELRKLLHLDSVLLEKYPFQLSGGQQQRVSLMRALVLDPNYLLMDEPLSALDPLIRAELQEEFQMLFHKLKKTVIFVTHDIHEAQALGHQIYLLKSGEIEQQGAFDELWDSPATDYVRKFLNAQSVHLKAAEGGVS